MRTYANQLIASLLLVVSGFAQSTVLTNTTVLTGTTKMGAVNISHNVTVNIGGPAASTATGLLTGQASLVLANAFITPPTIGNPSWGTPQVYFATPDAGTPNWGCAVYANVHTAFTVTVAGGTGVTATSGAFTASWNTPVLTISGIGYTVASFGGTTTATLTESAPNGAGQSASIDTPGALIASAFSSTEATTGFNACPIAGLGTPSANTIYWIGAVMASNTQSLGATGSIVPCPGQPQSAVFNQLASFTSNGSWPANLMSGGGGGAYGSGYGCIAAYIPLTYTTSNKYTVISLIPGACDSGNTTCPIAIPPTQAGDGFFIFEATAAAGSPVLTPTDSAGDTFAAVGGGPKTVTGGPLNYSTGMYWIDRVSSGVTSITCHTTVLDKDTCWAAEINGTIPSGSVDASCYQTATSATTPYTGCTTGTTANATELWLNIPFDAVTWGNAPWASTPFVPTGSWSLGGSAGATGGNTTTTIGIFTQTTSATGTCTPTGTAATDVSHAIVADCITLK